MKTYQSHKTVEAAPIKWLTETHIVVEGENGAETFDMPYGFCARGTPVEGDFLVHYGDGYLSWSPKLIFEEGYTEKLAIVEGDVMAMDKEADRLKAEEDAAALLRAEHPQVVKEEAPPAGASSEKTVIENADYQQSSIAADGKTHDTRTLEQPTGRDSKKKSKDKL